MLMTSPAPSTKLTLKLSQKQSRNESLPAFSGEGDFPLEVGECLVIIGAGGAASGTSIQSEPEIYEKVLRDALDFWKITKEESR